ncbi:LANO_0H01464g1_1 [Lachancea nothofagi CBS 11611]|uniref:Putative lipoate-protein ligase A n=1 Tax=Lachancea nothofagi CBS 11611 TaxID=1266666 RepID=A0A1G4KKR9_9SACH|nr:LANO_0H01464g1_1 [Lachancea nothofagi CBS 11611]
MLKLSRHRNLAHVLAQCAPVQYRSLGSQTPFDLEPEAQDDKYADLNTMYSQMFTEGGKSAKRAASQPSNNSFDIDALNAEIAEAYNFAPRPISGDFFEQIVKSPGRFIIQSLSTNPYYNLALEEYVFRNTPAPKGKLFSNERLLFYVNDKCVVIGKNQTPWKELFLDNCETKGYKYVRRRSGGGAVVHDLGNVNYSYLTSRDNFQREYFNKQIVHWLTDLRPEAEIHLNHRGDIHLNDFKVSGSAFKIAMGKSYHHGTMLINSDLSSFKGLLKPDNVEHISWSGGSVESVRSNVSNMKEAGFSSTDEFINICTDGFRRTMQEEVPVYLVDETTTTTDQLSKNTKDLASGEWLYESGPSFSVTIAHHSISVVKGVIKESTIPGCTGQHFKDFVNLLRQNQILGVNVKI